MLPDRVSNPGPLAYESGALPIALRQNHGKHLGLTLGMFSVRVFRDFYQFLCVSFFSRLVWRMGRGL